MHDCTSEEEDLFMPPTTPCLVVKDSVLQQGHLLVCCRARSQQLGGVRSSQPVRQDGRVVDGSEL